MGRRSKVFSGRPRCPFANLPHPFFGNRRQAPHPSHHRPVKDAALPFRPHGGAGRADPAEDVVGEPDHQVEGLPRRRGQEPRRDPGHHNREPLVDQEGQGLEHREPREELCLPDPEGSIVPGLFIPIT